MNVNQFWNLIDKTDNCWIWNGKVYRGNLCQFFYVDSSGFRTTKIAHRFAWELLVGDLPKNITLIRKCSNELCVNPEHYVLGTEINLFWSKVDKKSDDECWEWKDWKGNRGYGLFRFSDGKRCSAHRASWIINFGEIPNGMFVCHTCDNPSCCNPFHLFLGTPKDNTQDMMRKGRWVCKKFGEQRKNTKLKLSDIIKIRELRKQGLLHKEIAEIVGTTRRNIGRILKGESWKWV